MNLKLVKRFLGISLFALFITPLSHSADKNLLLGKWKCVQESDFSKVVTGYTDSIEITPANFVLNYMVHGGIKPMKGTYNIQDGHLVVHVPKNEQVWDFEYKLLANGELTLHKEPWNWHGWFSRDVSAKRRSDPHDPFGLFQKIESQTIDPAPACEFDEKKETRRQAAERYYKTGLFAYADGRRDEAIQQWRMAMACNPTNPNYRRAAEKASLEKQKAR